MIMTDYWINRLTRNIERELFVDFIVNRTGE